MVAVSQGDVFWADLGYPFGSEPAKTRPVVVVQSDLFNRRSINTVVVVPCTTNVIMKGVPGNVSLRKGEANIPRSCVVVAAQVSAIDRSRLRERTGTLSRSRLESILDGIDLVLRGVDAGSART